MSLADDRLKWNARYTEAGLAQAPSPHPLALRWRGRMIGGRMLDAACGQGRGIAAAGHLFHTIYGVDVSDVAIAQGQQLWPPGPGSLGGKIQWTVGDVTTMPWEPDSLGLVCAFGFTDLPFVRRMRECIRWGGMLLYEGFSKRQLTVKRDLDPAWTTSFEDWEALLPGWQVLERGETLDTPYRIRYAAVRP
ncbi:MAG TPA: methyltransferase domain-containing protein [bacterium]